MRDTAAISQREPRRPRRPGRPLGTARLAEFCRSLGTLLAAGVPLMRAFAVLEEEAPDPGTRAVYAAVSAGLRKGVPLSDAMERQAPAFPALLVAMLRSAEDTGSLDKSCLRMAALYEKEHRMEQETAGSLMYPAILAVLLTAVLVILMTFVVPQFKELFAQLEHLPVPTVLLLAVSDFLSGHWLAAALGAAAAAVLLRALFLLPAVRLRRDRLLLHAPVVGRLHRRICTARFARTLSSLYAGGVPIVAALQSSRDTVGNCWIASQFDGVLAQVRAGRPLSEALRGVDGFERRLWGIVLVGEETGRLDSMLSAASDAMDCEAEAAARQLTALIEPVMIVVMAILVAFVIIAVILPIYQSYGVICGPY